MKRITALLCLLATPLFSKEIDGLSIAFTGPEGTTDRIMIRPEMNLEAYIFKWEDLPQPATVALMFPDFKYWEERGKPEPSFEEWISKENESYLEEFADASFRESEIHVMEPVECGDFTGFQCWFREKEESGVVRLHRFLFLTDGYKKMKVMFRGPRELEDALLESLKTIESKANQAPQTTSASARV